MKILLLTLTVLLSLSAFTQERKHSTFYYQRATLFERLPVARKDIVFLGNSITNGCEWHELFRDKRVKNRGISGDVVLGVYDRLDAVLNGQPRKIFLLIGINDVARGASADTIVRQIELVLEKIKKDSPRTKVYVQSILPVSDHFGMFGSHTSRWRMIPLINKQLKELAHRVGVTYVDLYSHFVDEETGKLKITYSNDGLHLLGNGYLLWRDIIKPYVKER